MTDLIAVALHAPFRSFEEATQHLEDTAERAGVRHLSYWFLNFNREIEDVVWVATYDPQYMSDYMQNYTPLGDPAIENLLDHDRIIDWAQWECSDDTCRTLHAMASRYGITRYGISIAFKTSGMGTAVFSVNVDCDEASWPRQRELLLERYQPFAHEFHERMKPLVLLTRQNTLSYPLCA
jgi:Autoinducer binding domain